MRGELPRFDPARLRRELQVRHLTATQAADAARINRRTMARALRGEPIRWASADAIRDMLRAQAATVVGDYAELLRTD